MRVIRRKPLLEDAAWLDYVIVTVLVLMSGTPVVMGLVRMEVFTVIGAVFLLSLFMIRKEPPFTSRFLVVVSVLSGILVIQCITFSFWPFHTMLGFMLRLFIGYAAIRLVRELPKRYVLVMYYLCLISFCFHSLAILREIGVVDLIQYFKPVDGLVNPYAGFNVVVHHFMGYGRQYSEYFQPSPWRNSSCFWEPSVFSAYLTLAIVLLGITKRNFEKRQYRRIFAVLVIALLTTLSTTGYVLLPLCLLFHLRGIHLTARYVPKMLGLALILALFCVAAYHLDFVGMKIREHSDRVAYREPGWEMTRFGSFAYNMEYIQRKPMFGWGLHSNTRYMLSSGIPPRVMANGLSDFTVRFGLVGLSAVLISVWIGVYQLTGRKWVVTSLFLIFFLAQLNSVPLLSFSTYLGLLFLGSRLKSRSTVTCFQTPNSVLIKGQAPDMCVFGDMVYGA